jgi:hypothetical protein
MAVKSSGVADGSTQVFETGHKFVSRGAFDG